MDTKIREVKRDFALKLRDNVFIKQKTMDDMEDEITKNNYILSVDIAALEEKLYE